jgi:hypothetical protein
LTTVLCYWAPTANAPLNDGQNIHKNILPIIATVLD